MFEYIKRVSIAIKFLAKKIEPNNKLLGTLFLKESLTILEMSQKFRNFKNEDTYDVADLAVLKDKVLFLIDLIDFSRMDNSVTLMNASVFVNSLRSFVAHIDIVIEHENSLEQSLSELDLESKNLNDIFARRSVKTNLQNKFFTETLNKKPEKTESPYFEKTLPETQKEVKNPAPENNVIESTDVVVESETKRELENRRNRIVNSLKQGGGSIKDISSKLTDINEKTIQRDLIELMRDRKVIMLGKKRWAKYYLK